MESNVNQSELLLNYETFYLFCYLGASNLISFGTCISLNQCSMV